MTMRWSYLGALGPGDALDWGGDYSGNIPAAGTLPDIQDTSVYRQIRGLAQEGQFEGRQVDWGAWAIKVNGPELMSVLADCYGDLSDRDPKSVLGRHIQYAKKLGETKYVALISTEM